MRDIDELLRDLEAIPAEKIPAVISMLAARLITTTNGNGTHAETADRLLTAKEAAPLVGVSPDWLYDHAGEIPFAVRLPMAKKKKTGETKTHLRFSAHGIQKWIARKAGRG
jgi:predicted DNA-binding transcriptional regulator AlpA